MSTNISMYIVTYSYVCIYTHIDMSSLSRQAYTYIHTHLYIFV